MGAAAAVVLTVAAFAYQSLQVPYRAPALTSPLPALGGCSPAPCANLQGYTLWVANINVKDNLATMQITFRNSSDSTHAGPEDLLLIDSMKHSSPPVFDTPGCTHWTRHEFSHGATYGPLNMCFKTANTWSPPLVLLWTPDFGFTCCHTEIKLS